MKSLPRRHIRFQLEQLESRELPSATPLADVAAPSNDYSSDRILVRWLAGRLPIPGLRLARTDRVTALMRSRVEGRRLR